MTSNLSLVDFLADQPPEFPPLQPRQPVLTAQVLRKKILICTPEVFTGFSLELSTSSLSIRDKVEKLTGKSNYAPSDEEVQTKGVEVHHSIDIGMEVTVAFCGQWNSWGFLLPHKDAVTNPYQSVWDMIVVVRFAGIEPVIVGVI